MTDTLDRQLMRRYAELIVAHECRPVFMSPSSFDLTIKTHSDMAINGKLTHIFYSKGNRSWVAWVPSEEVRWLIDAYGEH